MMLNPETIYCVAKHPVPIHEKSSLWVIDQGSLRLPKHYRLLLPLVSHQKLKISPYCWRAMHFGCRKIQTGSNLKAYSLRTSFLNTRRPYTSCQGRKAASIPPTSDIHETQQWPAWQDVPKAAIVAPIFLFTQGPSKSIFYSLHSAGRILKSLCNRSLTWTCITQPAADWSVSCCSFTANIWVA